MYDIRQINSYFQKVHSRYYIDTNSVIYTSIAAGTNKIMINGLRRNIAGWRKANISKLNRTNMQIILVPNSENKYYMLYDGTILQRMKTQYNQNTGAEKKEASVNLICYFGGKTDGKIMCNVARFVAGAFIGDVEGKHVHHIDGNRENNKLSNLLIVSPEEHRLMHSSKENTCSTTSPKGRTPQAMAVEAGDTLQG